ncbi:PREDICTED: uncharacterized protein C11orf16 homolog [Chrysochloris asiatica]|uniref:Uncharacterized protein C11orf16 homolog n=1 Tax=Chrysochloris asiatica TaxID=185453 RepID=A0A9B0WWW9_CHRAS|nr:PREDICTED: uncharacterized protein C11orf16 homolog [Chrysochloris asiatica]
MDFSTGPKYCSVTTALKAPCWDGAAPRWDLSFACPFALRTPWLTRHNLPTRYMSNHPCLHMADPAWQRPGWLGRVENAADTWVLARREPDGFYYRAQIKAAPELERQGSLLVEFEAPFVTGPNHSVVLEGEVVQLSPPMAYPLQPGDNVLAPWEPNGQKYGPGTVLSGVEARDPLRASKDEEITVYFWNGKTAKVPLGRVRWVSPVVWKAAVERLHKPVTREHPSPLLWAPCCSLLGTVTGYVPHGLPLGTPFLCPPCHPCCQRLCQGCLSCCSSAGPTWWPLTWTSEVTARKLPEPELKPTAQLLPIKGPKEEEVALQSPMDVSSSSSSSFEEKDLETDVKMGLSQRLLVNSTVNTDPILEKTPWQEDLCRPEWRYWRRSGPEPCPRKPEDALYRNRRGSWISVKWVILKSQWAALAEVTGQQLNKTLQRIWKEEVNKQLRIHSKLVSSTKELSLEKPKEATTLLNEAKHEHRAKVVWGVFYTLKLNKTGTERDRLQFEGRLNLYSQY